MQSKEYKSSKDKRIYKKRHQSIQAIKLHGLRNFSCIFCKKFFERGDKFTIKKIPLHQWRFIVGQVKSTKPRSKKYKHQFESLWNRLSKEEQQFLGSSLKFCISPDLKYYIICNECIKLRDSKGKLRRYLLYINMNEINFYEDDDIKHPQFESDLFKNRVNIS